MTTPGKELLFLALGGSDEIGMNVNLYGCDGKWLMVDLGLTFAGADYPGIDFVGPAKREEQQFFTGCCHDNFLKMRKCLARRPRP